MMLSAGKVRMIPCHSEADSFLVVSLILDIYVVLERSACKKIFVRFSSFLLLNSANLSRNPRPRKKDWELANFRVASNKGQSRHAYILFWRQPVKLFTNEEVIASHGLLKPSEVNSL